MRSVISAALVIVCCRLAMADRNLSATQVYQEFVLFPGGPRELVLRFLMNFGAMASLPRRREADTNHDGYLDDEEIQSFGERLRTTLGQDMRIIVDGQPVSPVVDKPLPITPSRALNPPTSLSYLIVAHYRIPLSLEHMVKIDPSAMMHLMDLGYSFIDIREDPAVEIPFSYRGSERAGRHLQFLFSGPITNAQDDRSVTLRIERPVPLFPIYWMFLCLGGVLVTLGVKLLWGRSSSSSGDA
jgi:hypothetical protein